ncbi:MAG: type II secretion system F family protein [Bacillota bacterium]
MIVIISCTIGVLIFSIVMLILFPLGVHQEEINTRIQSISNMDQKELVIDEELKKPISERFLRPISNAAVNQLKKLIPASNGLDSENPKRTELKKKLRQAGFLINVTEYRMIQLLVSIGIVILIIIITLFFTNDLKMVLMAGAFGFYTSYVFLRLHLAVRTTKRRENIRQQLPEVLDMLSVSVEAGLGLEQAILHVIDHFKGHLVDELNISYREMTMGRSRRDALLGLGERCEVDDVKSFVRAINQASQLGISIKNVLRSQSAFIRQSRKNKIEEKAQKVSVKILLPLAFFIFPVMFIILLGPAAVSIYQQLM